MAKSVHNDVLDASLNYIKNNCDKMVFCSAQPTSYAEANATYALADVAMTSSDFTGPADGDVSGRKLTVNEKASVEIDASGTGNHVALIDTGNEKLLYVTTAASQAVVDGNTMTFQSWDIEIADPA